MDGVLAGIGSTLYSF